MDLRGNETLVEIMLFTVSNITITPEAAELSKYHTIPELCLPLMCHSAAEMHSYDNSATVTP